MKWSRMARSWLRDAAGELLHLAGATRLPRRQVGQLSIVSFHRVLPAAQRDAYPFEAIAVTPDELRWFLDVVGQHFTCGPLVEIATAWRTREIAKPCLAITFDDGQLDNFVHARPVLAELGLRATFYVTVRGAETGQLLWHDRMAYALVRLISEAPSKASELLAPFTNVHRVFSAGDAAILRTASGAVRTAKRWSAIDRRRWLERAEQLLGSAAPEWDGMMTANELKQMADAGHEIGSHSISHEILPLLNDADLESEIAASRAPIERLTGHQCESFCYPNGDYDERCKDLVSKHFRFGVSTRWGGNLPSSDPFALRRYDMTAEHVRSRSGALSESRLAWRMSGIYPGLGR